MKLTKRLKKFKLRENLDDTNHNIQCFVSKNGRAITFIFIDFD